MLAYQNSQSCAAGHFEIISLENGQEVWRSPVMANRILNGGLETIIQHHVGNDANPLEITSLEIGDGDTAVTAGDTALDNLVLAGVPVAKRTPSTLSVVIEFFIVDAELPAGIYRELGLRAGATLYTRALFTTPYTKVDGRDTIIRYTLSYSAV
ncbi:MAG: hypothetical protein ACU0B7_03430 [Paracoccaceae bacterium]